ncbi:MAG: hypothetical protein EOP88_07440 [Verrucomicrobiaceae bacterium]|nr:MAG: hypothetical protein EOP88_07440 [Verrucomicrobiaceae bacterium]
MKPQTRSRAAAAALVTSIAIPVGWTLLNSSGQDAAQADADPAKPAATAPLQQDTVASTLPLTLPTPDTSASPQATDVGVIATPGASIVGSRWQSPSQPELARFSNWATAYQAAPEADRPAMVAEGVAAAGARREVMGRLIRSNPEEALASAVPVMVRRDLPAEVVSLLEERVSGRGSIEMLSGTPPVGSKTVVPSTRLALIGRTQYEAFSYGRRAKLNYLPEVSINGIALDGALAVSDSPVRVLESGETADGREVEEVCEVSGETTPVKTNGSLNDHEVTAMEIDGKIQMVCRPSHLAKLEARLIGGEGLQANGAPGSSAVSGKPDQAWTHGPKKVLIIRIDFSDLPGVPKNSFTNLQITPDEAVAAINGSNKCKDFYEQTSYNKTTLVMAPVSGGVSPDVTPVLRMPSTAASYATAPPAGTGNSTLLHSDARALATGAGYNVDNYDRIGVVFTSLGSIPGSNLTYGGLGSTPGKNFWTNGSYVFSVIAHEVGHNYGLNHSSSWTVTDGNPVSPNGTKEEYGDVTDVMGDGNDITNQFNHWNKSIAQWLPDAAVTTANTSGTYRIHRFDSPSSNLANPLALKVVRNRTQDYWIGYRRATTRAEYNNGAYVVWGANENVNGLLLDLNTPGNTVSDAPLAVGQTFNDTATGITLTTVARGGSGADEYLDVQVGFQPRIAWTSSNYNVSEQSGTATLTVSRSNNSTGAVSIHWATAPGTGPNAATSPADFTTSSGNLNWADGDSSDKTVTIPIVADSASEGTEKFTVTLSAISGGVLVDDPAATVSIADPGAIDSDFAADFINNSVQKVIVQPDGGILFSGQGISSVYPGSGEVNVESIGRLKPDGKLDMGFGIVSGGSPSEGVRDMARQPDGKVLVCGSFTTRHGVARNRVARLNVDGTLDTSFNPGTGANGTVNAIVLQPDGKVIIGGAFTSVNGSSREYLARLNADGSLDNTFTGPDFGDPIVWNVSALALQADGKLLVGGAFYFNTGACTLCRVTTTGAIDTTFNGVGDGATSANDFNMLTTISSIVPLLDGKILIAGPFGAYNRTLRGGLARLTNTGALDATFPATSDGGCNSILLQPDGKILVGGSFTTFNGVASSRIVRLSSAGAVDTTFGGAGGPSVTVHALVAQPDGRVVMGTDFGSFQGQTQRPIFRFFGGQTALQGTIQFAATSASANEGSSALLSVTRTGGSAGALSVNYSTVAGTAGSTDFAATAGTLSWANGDAAAKTITVPVTTDALVEGSETFTVNLGQPLMGGALLGAAQTATVSVSDPGAVSAYQTWREAKFTPSDLGNSAISGDLADPDSDGIANLMEFALKLEPKTSGQAGLPAIGMVNVSGSDYLTLTFRRLLSTPELAYQAQTSGTLSADWQNDAILVGSPVNNGDGTETVTYRDTVAQTAASKRFMKLQVKLVP